MLKGVRGRSAVYREEEMRLLGEVLPNVAAQLRGAMGNLYAAMQSAAPEMGKNSALVREREIMQQSYYRMLRLVNNLSSASMLLEEDALTTQNMDVVEWLGDICRQAQPLAEEVGIQVIFSCDLRSHVVAVNREMMERLLWNLLSNALKFTPRGGKITVSLRQSGGQLLLTVADTGCGIREELLDTVFDRYLHTERQDPHPHGLGLGLPLCRRIAEGHGGRLMLSSEEGKGTTVTVALPDRRTTNCEVRDVPFHYAGGFQPVVMELADALPYTAFRPQNLD